MSVAGRETGGIANERANYLKRTSTHALVEVTVKCFITAFARFTPVFKRFLYRAIFRVTTSALYRVVNNGKVMVVVIL